MATTPTPCLNESPRISLDLVAATPGGPVGLVADIIPSTQPDNGIQNLADGLFAPARPRYVSSLPGSPYDGEEVYFNVGNGINWHFRYDSHTSNSAKWEFLGGPELHLETQGADSLNGQGDGNYHLISNGPAVVAPLQGVYRIRCGALVNPSNDVGALAHKYGFGPQIGGSFPGDLDSCYYAPAAVTSGAFASSGQIFLERTLMARSVNAGDTVRMTYANSAPTNTEPCAFSQRTIAIQPMRVSA